MAEQPTVTPTAEEKARAQATREENSRVRAQQPPPEKQRTAAPPSRSPRRGDLKKVEDRLNEMFAVIAMGQSAAAVATGDLRHMAGAHVTNELSPTLVEAWIKLAQENDAVRRVLIRMSQTSAWGEVAIASIGFVYSQGQAYGVLPAQLPNPWVEVPVPPSQEVARETAKRGTTEGQQEKPAEEMSAQEKAEAARREVEERRKHRGS